MPDIVVHNRMGDRVIEQLDEDISSLIDPEIFHFSVMGPDPYIFYRFFAPMFRHGINKRSTTMHRTKTGHFLMALAKRSQSKEMFSFTAGFLCHYAIDSTSHPFIYGLAEYKSDMHTAIEHRLDVIELERQGKQRRDIMELFTAFPDLPELKEAMKEVYGWDDNAYKIGHRHMKLFHWIIKDQHGILNGLVGWLGGKFVAISYRTKMADMLDLTPFGKLEEQSVDFGVQLITALYKFRNGEIEESKLQEIIGNRSYAGGEADSSIMQ